MTGPTRPPRADYRPDIDGLRAVSVLAVVIFHAFPALAPGGYVGVDVFFVISGFLITSIIVDDLAANRFVIVEFYRRRILRIFPAVLAVLGASGVAGWFLLFADEYQRLGLHMAAGASLSANLMFWTEAGYFDLSGQSKPLLHLWSLGVEEQFYLLWPVVLLAAWKYRINLLVVSLFIGCSSLYLSLRGSTGDDAAAFFSPLARAWELVAGGILALHRSDDEPRDGADGGPRLSRSQRGFMARHSGTAGRVGSHALSLCGLAVLAWCVLNLGEDHPYPAPWALLPVAGALMIIRAGPRAWINRWLLSPRPIVWIGLISFPLYLWHWPILSILKIVSGESPTPAVVCAALLVSFCLAWLTFVCIERPVRRPGGGPKVASMLLVGMVGAGCAGYVIYAQEGIASRTVAANATINRMAFELPKPSDVIQAHCLKMLGRDFSGHCLSAATLDDLGRADPIFVGDSHSLALSLGYQGREQAHASLGKFGCVPLIGVDLLIDDLPKNCLPVYARFFELAESVQPQGRTVILTARHAFYVEGGGFGEFDLLQHSRGSHVLRSVAAAAPGGTAHAGTRGDNAAVFRSGLMETLRLLTQRADRVVIVLQIPELGFDPRKCVARPLRSPSDQCYLSRREVLERQQAYRAIVGDVAARFPEVVIYDPIDLFCDESRCQPMRNGLMLYRDDDHLSTAGAQMILDDMRSRKLLR